MSCKAYLLCCMAACFSASISFAAEETAHHVHDGHEQQHAEPQHSHHADHSAHSEAAPTASEQDHVPPDPPSQPLPALSHAQMMELMQMDDTAPYGLVRLDQLEWRDADAKDALGWELEAFYGNDYHKLWVEAEGERGNGDHRQRIELKWDRIIGPFWSVQGGVRHDILPGPSRTWAALALQGTAPGFVEFAAALYVSEQGRTAARVTGEYDLLITQRLILQPEFELEFYGKDDSMNRIGSGLSHIAAGLRLRYEIRREFAPYIGLHWSRRLGATADLAQLAGEDESDAMFVAGVRVWY